MLKMSEKYDSSKGASDGDENGGNSRKSTARIHASGLLSIIILKRYVVQKRQQIGVAPQEQRFKQGRKLLRFYDIRKHPIDGEERYFVNNITYPINGTRRCAVAAC